MIRWNPFRNVRRRVAATLSGAAALAFAGALSADARTALDAWPEEAGTDAAEVRAVDAPSARADEHRYATEHFLIRSDRKLSRGWARQIGLVCEATYALYHELFPRKAAPDQNRGRRVVRIFHSDDNYRRAGGLSNTRGLYRDGEILVRRDSLGVDQGRFGPLGTLSHEVAHRMNAELFGALPVWLDEGLATFIESLPYRAGAYTVAGGHHERSRRRFERAATIPRDEFRAMSDRDWLIRIIREPEKSEALVARAYLSAHRLICEEDASSLVAALYSDSEDSATPAIASLRRSAHAR